MGDVDNRLVTPTTSTKSGAKLGIELNAEPSTLNGPSGPLIGEGICVLEAHEESAPQRNTVGSTPAHIEAITNQEVKDYVAIEIGSIVVSTESPVQSTMGFYSSTTEVIKQLNQGLSGTHPTVVGRRSQGGAECI